MTELIWDGKYNGDGKKVKPIRVELPFQTVETVNESAQQRQMTLDLFASGRPTEWRNRLIWGETVVLLRELLAEDGGIYVHCDWRVSRYVGAVLTETFGSGDLRNEIIWH